jgi:hypothetical protein
LGTLDISLIGMGSEVTSVSGGASTVVAVIVVANTETLDANR